MKVLRPFFLFFTLLILFTTYNSYSEKALKPRVLVIPMINMQNDTRYDIICSTVSDTIILTLKLLGKYILISAPNYLNPYDNLKQTKIFIRKEKIDTAIYGKAFEGKNGEILFEISVYDRAKDKVTITKQEKASTLFDIFDAAERLVKGVMEMFSGVHIGFGSIVINNTGENGKYAVYLNGQLLGENIDRVDKVFNGRYVLEIKQERLLGKKVIFSKKITVYEDEELHIDFKIPRLTEEEMQTINKLKNEIGQNINNKEKENLVEKDLGLLTNMFQNITCCPSLKKEKEEIEIIKDRFQVLSSRWKIEDFILQYGRDNNANQDFMSLAKLLIAQFKRAKNKTSYKDILSQCLYNLHYFSFALRMNALKDFSESRFQDGINKYTILKSILILSNQTFYKLREEADFIQAWKDTYFSKNKKVFVDKIKRYFRDELKEQKAFFTALRKLGNNNVFVIGNPLSFKIKVNGAQKLIPSTLDVLVGDEIEIEITEPWFEKNTYTFKIRPHSRLIFISPRFVGYQARQKDRLNLTSSIPVHPAVLIGKDQYKISWDKLENASYYKVQLCTYRGGRLDIVSEKNKVIKSSYKVELKNPLLMFFLFQNKKNETYYYRICAVTKTGLKSPWSPLLPLKPATGSEKPSKETGKDWLIGFGSGVYYGEYFDFIPVIKIGAQAVSPYSSNSNIGTMIDFMASVNKRIFSHFYLGLDINVMYRFSDFSLIYFKSFNTISHKVMAMWDFMSNFLNFGYGIGYKHFMLQIKFTYYWWYQPQSMIERVGFDAYSVYLSYLF